MQKGRKGHKVLSPLCPSVLAMPTPDFMWASRLQKKLLLSPGVVRNCSPQFLFLGKYPLSFSNHISPEYGWHRYCLCICGLRVWRERTFSPSSWVRNISSPVVWFHHPSSSVLLHSTPLIYITSNPSSRERKSVINTTKTFLLRKVSPVWQDT